MTDKPNKNEAIGNLPECQLGTCLVFSSIFVIVSALLVWSIRLPLESTWNGPPASAYLKTICLALALIWSGRIVRVVYKRASFVSQATYPAVRFLLLVFLLCLPWICSRILADDTWQIVCTAILAIITVTGLSVGIRAYSSLKTTTLAWAVLLGTTFATAIATSMFYSGYISPLAFELTLSGEQIRDTVFHAAIANMLEYHGQQSLDLDGFIPISYHVFYHRLVGSFSHWIDLNVLHGYSLFIYVVAMPMLVLTFIEAVIFLRPTSWKHLAPPTAIAFLLCWLLFLSIFQYASYFSSETYIVSLLIVMASVPVMASWLEDDVSFSARAVMGIALFLAILLSSLSKISSGAVLFTGVAFAVTAHSGYRISGFLTAIILAVLPFGLVFLGADEFTDAQDKMLSPFHFLFEHKRNAIFHLILAGVALWVFLKNMPTQTGRCILSATLLIMIFAALTSSMLLILPAGAAYYFANPGMWFSIMLITMISPRLTALEHLDFNRQMVVTFVVAIVVLFADMDRWRVVDKFRKSVAKIENETALRRIQRIASELERDSADPVVIVIEPGFDQFWNSYELCWVQPLTIPAVTSYPLLTGLQPEKNGCELSKYYGLSAYDKKISASRVTERAELCDLATQRGFMRILSIGPDSENIHICK